MNLIIKPSDKPDKKFTAIFSEDGKKVKTINFGLKGSTTFLDTGDKNLRKAYRARHQKVYDKAPPMSASRLSFEIIWGASTSYRENLKSYKSKYGFN